MNETSKTHRITNCPQNAGELPFRTLHRMQVSLIFRFEWRGQIGMDWKDPGHAEDEARNRSANLCFSRGNAAQEPAW